MPAPGSFLVRILIEAHVPRRSYWIVEVKTYAIDWHTMTEQVDLEAATWALFKFDLKSRLTYFFKTSPKYSTWSGSDFEKIMISSKYTLGNLRSFWISFIILWKFTGAFINPKGKTSNRKVRNSQINVVISSHSSDFGICKYPENRWSVVKNEQPFRSSRISSIFEIWKRPGVILRFSGRKSAHIRGFPYFFFSTTIENAWQM